MSARAELFRRSQQTNHTANDLLKAGVAVGVVGVVGALIGAVCPVCVVATPSLLGLGAVNKLRAKWLRRSATQPSVEP